MNNSIFLNVYFNVEQFDEIYEKKFQKKLKEIFLNKWLCIYIYNCQIKDKKLFDLIYEYANMYGIKISLIINEDNSILDVIEENYTNIDTIIFNKKQDYNNYNRKMKRLGIECIYSNEKEMPDELNSYLIVEEEIKEKML